MDQRVLQKIGFSKNQAKVYVTLLEAGSATAGELAVKSMVHRSNVYDALDQLIEQGLISYINKGPTRVYMPTNPENIKERLKEKEALFDNILPDLKSRYRSEKKAHVQVFEGLQGLKTISDGYLREGHEILAIETVKGEHFRMGPLLAIWHKRRIKNKIRLRQLHSYSTKERRHVLNEMPYTEGRYLEEDNAMPASVTITGDRVIFYVWSHASTDTKEKDDKVLIISVDSKFMADEYKKYFEYMWKHAKK